MPKSGSALNYTSFNLKTGLREDVRDFVDDHSGFLGISPAVYQMYVSSDSVLNPGGDDGDIAFATAMSITTRLKKKDPTYGNKTDYDVITTVGGISESTVFAKYVVDDDFKLDGLPASFKERKDKLFAEFNTKCKEKLANAQLSEQIRKTSSILTSGRKKASPYAGDYDSKLFKDYPPNASTVDILDQMKTYDDFSLYVMEALKLTTDAGVQYKWLSNIYDVAYATAPDPMDPLPKVCEWLDDLKEANEWSDDLFAAAAEEEEEQSDDDDNDDDDDKKDEEEGDNDGEGDDGNDLQNYQPPKRDELDDDEAEAKKKADKKAKAQKKREAKAAANPDGGKKQKKG